MNAAGNRVCVIGGGSSGLTAARHLLASAFEVDVLEAQSDIGGIWNYSTPAGRVYDSTTMISSKPFTEFPDFPMPADFPDYPTHRDVIAYLRAYAQQFGIDRVIRFDSHVRSIRPNGGPSGWIVSAGDGKETAYDVVVVANGHNSSAYCPDYPGTFDGTIIHSARYRRPEMFLNKRVLVVGRGNSGCDIAVEATGFASRVFSSARRGYHFIPRYFGGKPSDQVGDDLLRAGVPLAIRRVLAKAAIRAELGDLETPGLPTPDHELFETHPIINTTFPLAVQAGKIVSKPGVARLEGNVVHFSDGSTERVDIIVLATGYKIDLSFLRSDDVLLSDDVSRSLYLNVFHPARDDLFFAGFIQPDSGQFGLVHWQMRAVALYLAGIRDSALPALRFQQEKKTPKSPSSGGVNYLATQRHMLEVEHWSYLGELQTLAAELSS